MKGSGQYQTGLGWWELKMLALLGFIFLMLAAGRGYQRQATGDKLLLRPVFWWWKAPLNERLGVTFKAPWLMTEADLTWGRVVYNLMTKPGFRWLFFQLGLGVVASVLLTKGAFWLMGRAWQGVNTLASSTLRVQIAGTVVIANSRGLIYTAGGTGEYQGEEVYGFYLATVKISIVQG